MWSPKTGLNKKGEEFLAEGKQSRNKIDALKPESSLQDIANAFQKSVLNYLDNVKFSASPLFNNSDATQIKEFRTKIDGKIKGAKAKPKNQDYVLWFYEAVCTYVDQHKKDAFTGAN